MTDDLVARLRRVVSEGLPKDEPALLAVSGGIDSMVLFDAALASRPPALLRVATYDHGSGEHSRLAVEFVRSAALSAGVTVVIGTAPADQRASEADWREGRLTFLQAAALEYGARICTAHTRDDQIETVLFRELRAAGARGLAGLQASGPTCRPLIGATRGEIERYAAETGLRWVDDPSNADRSFARNRLRLDILPALRRATPSIDATLAEVGEQAAQWRGDVDAAIDAHIRFSADVDDGTLDVDVGSLRPYGPDTLAIIWPALLARIGVAADWRGTRRLVEFTRSGSSGRRIQLSGGWEVARRRGEFEVRRAEQRR